MVVKFIFVLFTVSIRSQQVSRRLKIARETLEVLLKRKKQIPKFQLYGTMECLITEIEIFGAH